MALVVKNDVRPEAPLAGNPQRHGNRVFFARSYRGDIGDATKFGLWWLDLESGGIGELWSDAVFRDEYAYPSWELLAAIDDVVIGAIKWEESYECCYELFGYRIEVSQWQHYRIRNGDTIRIVPSDDWPSPPSTMTPDNGAALSGGAIHHWREGETLVVAVDDSHAFEHDGSAAVTKDSYEHAKAEHPMVPSNMSYRSLADYIGYNGDMYQQALKNGTPNLPDAIDADSEIRVIANIHDYMVAETEDGHVLFVRNDYPAGITNILHLIAE